MRKRLLRLRHPGLQAHKLCQSGDWQEDRGLSKEEGETEEPSWVENLAVEADLEIRETGGL